MWVACLNQPLCRRRMPIPDSQISFADPSERCIVNKIGISNGPLCWTRWCHRTVCILPNTHPPIHAHARHITEPSQPAGSRDGASTKTDVHKVLTSTARIFPGVAVRVVRAQVIPGQILLTQSARRSVSTESRLRGNLFFSLSAFMQNLKWCKVWWEEVKLQPWWGIYTIKSDFFDWMAVYGQNLSSITVMIYLIDFWEVVRARTHERD